MKTTESSRMPQGEAGPSKVGPSSGRAPRAVSVLVPVSERPSALDGIYTEFSRPLREAGLDVEFIFIVEPEFRKLVAPLESLREAGEPIQVLRTSHALGDTALLRAGAARATHDILLTLPPYPRLEPAGLPGVVEPVLQGRDMAVARRWPRRDSWLNRLQNRVLHLLLGWVGVGDRGEVNDVACGVRAIRREVFEVLPVYGDFNRFLPLLALRAGFEVEEVEAAQHPGDKQPRIYSPGVYLRRVLDVFGLYFLMRFTDRPLRFFGLVGVGGIVSGGAILLILAVQRVGGQAIADRPMLLLGALLLVLGVQAIALGLVGEIIVHLNAPNRSYAPVRRATGVRESPEASEPGGAQAPRESSESRETPASRGTSEPSGASEPSDGSEAHHPPAGEPVPDGRR